MLVFDRNGLSRYRELYVHQPFESIVHTKIRGAGEMLARRSQP